MARIVRVIPDVSGLDKVFDYRVPDRWDDQIAVGSLVRVDLHGRRVAGWVVATDVDPPAGVALREIVKLSSAGPSAEVVELATWTAHRWHGRVARVLKSASPDRMVDPVALQRAWSIAAGSRQSDPASAPVAPSREGRHPRATASIENPTERVTRAAWSAGGPSVVRVSPHSDAFDVVMASLGWLNDRERLGPVLLVTPAAAEARHLAGRLRAARHRVTLADDWRATATLSAGVVIGARSAVWATIHPRMPLAGVIVWDEHAEALQEERSPTWHARDVALERAARLDVPCLMVSPCPTPAALEAATSVWTLPRPDERAGWPIVDVIDRRRAAEEGRSVPGLFSPEFVAALRRSRPDGGRVVAILNRKGRAALLACATCGSIVRTLDGRHAMAERDGHLIDPVSGEERPKVCAVCAGTSLKRLRLGVSRAREELEALAGEPVVEVTSDTSGEAHLDARILIGTEALLHRIPKAAAVCFLDFDQELLAPRYRAAEQAMTLLLRAARVAGPRRGGPDGPGRLLIQTRLPQHRVLDAARHADPDRYADGELEQRRLAEWPPFSAVAMVRGDAEAWLEPLGERLDLSDVVALGPRDDRWLVRAPNSRRLAEVLDQLGPAKGVRVQVDPPRV